MAKYFLGSVGKAEAFRKTTNGMELAFVSKTLTDSGLNISTTKDDIRAGQGAPIQFSFYHDPSVEITLTDVLWKPEYLTAQLGAEFVSGSEDYITDTVTFVNGEATYTKHTINKSPIPCGEDYLIWAAPKGTDEWSTELVKYDPATNKLTLGDVDGEYCIRFLGNVDNARQAQLYSLIIPEELFLIITTPMFAGDACAPSKGKAAGHVTFEVPRFQLNGAQELAFNMSSNQTMSLAGIALASEVEDCDDTRGGKLLRIIEVRDNYTWVDDVVDLSIDPETKDVGEKPSFYGILKDGHLHRFDTADLSKIEYSIDEGANYTALTSANITLTANTDYIFRLISNPNVKTTLETGAGA